MGLLERFAKILGSVWDRFWNPFDCFLGLREGHLGPLCAIVRSCHLHMRNIDFTYILNTLRVTLGGFRPCDFIGIYEGFGVRRPFYIGIYDKIVKSSGKTCLEAS